EVEGDGAAAEVRETEGIAGLRRPLEVGGDIAGLGHVGHGGRGRLRLDVGYGLMRRSPYVTTFPRPSNRMSRHRSPGWAAAISPGKNAKLQASGPPTRHSPWGMGRRRPSLYATRRRPPGMAPPVVTWRVTVSPAENETGLGYGRM